MACEVSAKFCTSCLGVCHMTLLLGMQVSRPDGKPDLLGLKVLDEPAAVQSDPSLLTMQLRQASKQASPLVASLYLVLKKRKRTNYAFRHQFNGKPRSWY